MAKVTPANKKSKPKPGNREKPVSDESARGAALLLWFFRPGRLIAAAFVASAIVLSPYVPYLLPDLTSHSEYQFPLDQVQVNPPHRWVPATLLDEVLEQSGLPRSVSLLEGDVARDVAAAFAAHPWVRRVESVRITNEPGMRIVMEYRTPVAFVRTQHGFYPVDEEAILLPPVDFSLSDTRRLPVIRNVATLPRGEAGHRWEDTVVLSAARLAAVLAPEQDMDRYWRRFKLTAIVAPDIEAETAAMENLTFELETEGGSRIVWGRPPGADQLEPTVEQKLGRLEQYFSRFGDFNAPNGPYRIDIRLFDAISLQPLESPYR
jgi:hypothetical protein